MRKVRRSGIMLPLSIHAQSPFKVGEKQMIPQNIKKEGCLL